DLETHDIVHFAGHSYYSPNDPDQGGWLLHEGVLTAGELSKLKCPPLLVFSNSCQAGVEAQRESDYQDYQHEGQASSIGSAFLRARVRNYVGTFSLIH